MGDIKCDTCERVAVHVDVHESGGSRWRCCGTSRGDRCCQASSHGFTTEPLPAAPAPTPAPAKPDLCLNCFTPLNPDTGECFGVNVTCEPIAPTPAPTPDPRDAELAALRERVAALEAALRRLVTPTPEDEERGGIYTEAREALDGGTSALSAALATERTRTVDDVKARVEGLVRHGRTLGMLVAHDGGDLVFVDKVLAAIDAAREGT